LLAHAGWSADGPGRADLLRRLVGCVFKEHDPARVHRMLDLVAAQPAEAKWRQTAMLEGLAELARKKPGERPKPVALETEPDALVTISASADPRIADYARELTGLFTWKGRPADATVGANVVPLTAEQQARFNQGKILFAATCAACHQPGGEGLEGKAPPLRGSEWSLGHEGRLLRIVLQGVKGDIRVGEVVHNMEMPALGVLDDEQIAAVLTYLRREWGHDAPPVDPAAVARARAETAGRETPWTEKELLEIR
jgi:mono/diheme cytochrome c family protein